MTSTHPYDETEESLRVIARDFISRQTWFERLVSLDLKYELEGILCVYLAKFVPIGEASPDVWIIVGNTFPAFVFDSTGGPMADILEIYASTLEEWSSAVRSGESDLTTYMPIMYRNATREHPPSMELADLVAQKAEFVREHLVPALREG